MNVFRQTWWALVATVVFSIAKTATAIYLDEGQSISLRARVYTQAAIRTEGSYDDSTPSVKAGQLVQHRNFFNPELGKDPTMKRKDLADLRSQRWFGQGPLSFEHRAHAMQAGIAPKRL